MHSIHGRDGQRCMAKARRTHHSTKPEESILLLKIIPDPATPAERGSSETEQPTLTTLSTLQTFFFFIKRSLISLPLQTQFASGLSLTVAGTAPREPGSAAGVAPCPPGTLRAKRPKVIALFSRKRSPVASLRTHKHATVKGVGGGKGGRGEGRSGGWAKV